MNAGPRGLDFIFMLTRSDRTVADAERALDIAVAAGVRHIGFKDVGAPRGVLHRLARRIAEAGATSYLEVVSLDAESEERSAAMAAEIGVRRLLGGCRPDRVLPAIDGAAIEYYPFPGAIVGHPSKLEGAVHEIVASADSHCARPRVAGLDLLAWRWSGDGAALLAAVCAATRKPVIVAGSITSPARIAAARAAGAAAFTIGTAALDGAFPGAASDLASQLAAIMAATAAAESVGIAT